MLRLLKLLLLLLVLLLLLLLLLLWLLLLVLLLVLVLNSHSKQASVSFTRECADFKVLGFQTFHTGTLRMTQRCLGSLLG